MKIFGKIKRMLFSVLLLLAAVPFFSEESSDLHFNPWELIIYRPYNSEPLNDVWCWLKITDENGNDVTYSAVRSALYTFPNPSRKNLKSNGPFDLSSLFQPLSYNTFYKYRKTYYLSGGMAAKLNIKPGKYRISVYTPEDRTMDFPASNKEQWNSNVLEYDTQKPVKVLFVIPEANDNGFYTGAWKIDSKAPAFRDFTIPDMKQ